ncbi:MAG: hypothetical protein ACAI44_08835 [Candidatus Sericytochromatia bacterium]
MTDIRIVQNKQRALPYHAQEASWLAVCRDYAEQRTFDHFFPLSISQQEVLGLLELGQGDLWSRVEAYLAEEPLRGPFLQLRERAQPLDTLLEIQALIQEFIRLRAPLAFELLPCGMGLSALELREGERVRVNYCFRQAHNFDQARPVAGCQRSITVCESPAVSRRIEDFVCS